MTTSGKDPEPEAEKNAGLFADMLEYREVIAALAEFGPGFAVTVQRRWMPKANYDFAVSISKLLPDVDTSGYPATQWTVHDAHANLSEAVRRAVAQARARKEPSYMPPTPFGMPPGSLVRATAIPTAEELERRLGVVPDHPGGLGRAVAAS